MRELGHDIVNDDHKAPRLIGSVFPSKLRRLISSHGPVSGAGVDPIGVGYIIDHAERQCSSVREGRAVQNHRTLLGEGCTHANRCQRCRRDGIQPIARVFALEFGVHDVLPENTK